LLVDAEGSVWVGTNSGLDRLRRNALRVVAMPQTQEGQFAVATGNDGSVWTGNASLPLTQVFPDGRTVEFTQTAGTYVVRRDPEGQIWSAGALHLSHKSASGLTRLHYPRDQTDDVVSIAVDRNREPWISTIQQNVHHLSHGVWINQNQALGRRRGVLGAMRGDDEGNVWFAFSRNVVKWDGSQYRLHWRST
jgi:ligand-binding sensor domain-containing protein